MLLYTVFLPRQVEKERNKNNGYIYIAKSVKMEVAGR
jgi:hypothetical protein